MTSSLIKKILTVFGIFFFALPVFAYSSPNSPEGFINDFANMIGATAKQALEQKLVQFEKDTSNEISIVTINSLAGDTIENFAVKLFEEWKIGKDSKDNGILLLISKEDKKMKIEIGYGLEGALTDTQSYWIIQNIMRPAFQTGDYDGGISSAVDKIIAATKGEYVPSEQPSSSKKWSLGAIENFFCLVNHGIFTTNNNRDWSFYPRHLDLLFCHGFIHSNC